MKYDFSRIGKGLEAIAEAKRESDYQTAVKEEREKFDRRKERASAAPTYRGFEGEEGPQMPGYLLPGSDKLYNTEAAAKTAQRGLMPNEYDYTRSKADLAEKYGFYDRAKGFRAGALTDMQSQAAALELESKQRKSALQNAFYFGGGVEGVLDQINQFTGGNLTLENKKGGGYKVLEGGKATGLEFDTADQAYSYALALTSPESLSKYYSDREAAQIAAREKQYTKLNDESDTLVKLIAAEKKNPIPDQKTIDKLYARLETVQSNLQRYRGTDGGSADAILAAIQATQDSRKGGTTGAPAPAAPTPKAPAARHPLSVPTHPAARGRLFPEMEDYEDPAYGFANGGLVRGYADGGLTEEERSARMEHLGKAQQAFSASHAASQGPGGDANLVYEPQVDFDLEYEQPQYLANGGLVRGYADGGFFDYIKKSFTEKPEWEDYEAVQADVTDSSGKAVKSGSGGKVTSTVYRPKAKKATESPAEPEDDVDVNADYMARADGDSAYSKPKGLAKKVVKQTVVSEPTDTGGALGVSGAEIMRQVEPYLGRGPSRGAIERIYDYLFDPTDRKAAHMARMERLQMTGDLPYDAGFDDGDTGFTGSRYRIPAGGDEYDSIDDAVNYPSRGGLNIPSRLLPYLDPAFNPRRPEEMPEMFSDSVKGRRAQKYSGAFQSGGLVDYTGGGKVKGKGTETSDSNLARLSKNEYVVNAESMKIPGVYELVDAINNMGLQKRKAKKA